jgi:hypothetical protein
VIGWRDFLGADFEDKPKHNDDGNYYCMCKFVDGSETCPTHGDPPQKYPTPVTETPQP